ncbi:DNA primase [Xylella fastidiosa]|uniref:DNA primase family protein n=1 Tax=Xylella fastidiosa TaxID=2371 RepID=UPI00090040FC|nr:phage/plasmid primase, P4 family [Xylella fastidiosa]MDD0930243.1 phage/plasmid primase, P4 family [Xylella fastidiosa subsp. multiplex]QTX28719.1 DNA primase [Xylella fastidiosa subsp. multiplex]TNV88328.1 DNA primase [Xylella fastidiosa]TNV99331.1 DNA primase [Xylella fastidiosa]TNW00721.1 DNA primase [Xylella fastidiosa]
MHDSITILRHPVKRMAKTWRADGTIKAYDNAKFFRIEQRPLASLHDVVTLLSQLEHDPHACVIRGAYRGEAIATAHDPQFCTGKARRIAELYEDVPHHWMLVEIDNFTPRAVDPVMHPVAAVDAFISAQLPRCFWGADYYWQLSGSAGHPNYAGVLKAHVWFWLKNPYTSEQLKAWAASCGAALDASVFHVVQIHYTAAPVFEAGVSDPVPVRSGFELGWGKGAVPLCLDAATLATVARSTVSRHQQRSNAAAKDAIAQQLAARGMVLSTGQEGQLFITCPLAEHHTQPSGPTSTVYYPAHTGGYAKGAFVCQHAHCRDLPQAAFLAALGGDAACESDANTASTSAPRRKGAEAAHLMTDQANAARLVKHYGNQLMVSADQWFHWTGTHWQQDDNAAYHSAFTLSTLINAEAEEWRAKKTSTSKEQAKNERIATALAAWSKRSEMRGAIEATVALAKRLLVIPPKHLNAHPWALNCVNGTVDLRTGVLSAHRPEDYITQLIAVPYMPDACAPVFNELVARVVCGDPLLSAFLRRWFGYCATGAVRENVFAVHYGRGGNGKSTLLGIIAEVLGGYAAVAAPGLLTNSHANRHPTEIADLAGRRLVTTHEAGEGSVLRDDFVKQATGGDALKARYMRGDFFEFQPTHKLQLLTNYKPIIKCQDEGIWRRVLLIPYKAKFGTAEEVAAGVATCLQDTQIAERLKEEKTGVLAWIVAGAVEWYRNGLTPPECVRMASRAYQTEQDHTLQFLSEECTLGGECAEKLSTPTGGGLYPAYTVWCKASGLYPLSKTRFLGELERAVPHFSKKYIDRLAEGQRTKALLVHGVQLMSTPL